MLLTKSDPLPLLKMSLMNLYEVFVLRNKTFKSIKILTLWLFIFEWISAVFFIQLDCQVGLPWKKSKMCTQYQENTENRALGLKSLKGTVHPIIDRIAFKILILVFQSLQGNSPDYMTDIISRHLPSRSLRSSSALQLTVPRTSHSWGDRSFSHAAPKLWNNLPLEIRQSSSLTVFKSCLKTHPFSSPFVTNLLFFSFLSFLFVSAPWSSVMADTGAL